EKARLAYQHVNYFTNLYTVTRKDYLKLFSELADRGISRVAFCGVDEVAEIAWLSLQEIGMELTEVMDDDYAGNVFMGKNVVTLAQGLLPGNLPVVITSLKRSESLRLRLHALGVADDDILHPGFDVGLRIG